MVQVFCLKSGTRGSGVSLVVYFYSKIFHFLYYFNIADVIRLFFYIKYHHTTLF